MLEVLPELHNVRCVFIAAFEEFLLHDFVEGHAVDDLTRAFGDDDADRGLEREVNEEGNVVRALLTLGQVGEDKEPPPAGGSHALKRCSQRVHVTFSNTTPFEDADGHEPREDDENE